MNLDTVLTVAIGDLDTYGNKLSRGEWADFQDEVLLTLQHYGTVVAHAVGDGVGSDGVNEGENEATAVFIVVNPKFALHDYTLRGDLAYTARRYGQSSVAFAVDTAHEPVFTATPDGSRPLTLDEVIDQATEMGLID